MRRDSASFGGDLAEKIPRVISVGHIYLAYFNIRRGHFSQNKIMFVSDLNLQSEQCNDTTNLMKKIYLLI